MRIGIDLQSLPTNEEFGRTGIANYTYHLALNLLLLQSRQEYVFFFRKHSAVSDQFRKLGAEVVVLPGINIPFYSAHKTYAALMEQSSLDLLHGPANAVPLFYSGDFIVTIHDLAIYHHPEWFPRGQWLAKKLIVPRSIKKAKRIIAISESTKNDLIKIFGAQSDKIDVVPLGVEDRFFGGGVSMGEGGDGVGRPYILFVGTIEPRKNLTNLLRAFLQLPKEIKDSFDLIIAGKAGWRHRQIEREISDAKTLCPGHIKTLGYVPEDALPALYGRAAVFAFPSLFEGFGLPVLEAMAAGAPILTSNTSSLTETVKYRGGSCALLVNPDSIGEIRDGLLKLIRDMAFSSQISTEAREAARNYTWKKTAERTIEVYKKTL